MELVAALCGNGTTVEGGTQSIFKHHPGWQYGLLQSAGPVDKQLPGHKLRQVQRSTGCAETLTDTPRS